MKAVPGRKNKEEIKVTTSADREEGIATRMQQEDSENTRQYGRILGERPGVPKENYTYYINNGRYLMGFNKSDGGHETTRPGDIVALTAQEELINQNLINTHDARPIDPDRIKDEVEAFRKKILVHKKMTDEEIAQKPDAEVLEICSFIKGRARLDSIAELLKKAGRSFLIVQSVLDLRDKAVGR